MKYLVRAIKYFLSIVILLCLTISLLTVLNLSGGRGIEGIFSNGWTSVMQILLMFAGVSAIYPFFGFRKIGVLARGSYEELRPGVMEYMQSKGYSLESEKDGLMTFRLRSIAARMSRFLGEDRVSMKKEAAGYSIEGLNRDIVRLAHGLESRLRQA